MPNIQGYFFMSISSKECGQLGGGFKYFLFSPLFGEDSHFDSYFSNGLKPPNSQNYDLILVFSPWRRVFPAQLTFSSWPSMPRIPRWCEKTHENDPGVSVAHWNRKRFGELSRKSREGGEMQIFRVESMQDDDKGMWFSDFMIFVH